MSNTYTTSLAYYACNSTDPGFRFREYPEDEDVTRSAYQRDCDRIIHSSAFRKLQYKTQVFVAHEDDAYRTRLTHTIEVSRIARSLSRSLKINEDLAEAIALAHDLGHTPFGHTGEEELNLLSSLYGGFDHNSQSLKIVDYLEKKYPNFDGLNLTFETLEGLVKHNGPINKGNLSKTIEIFCSRMEIDFSSEATLEAQVAAVSDDIAYNHHDIDDGIRAGLFSMSDMQDLQIIGRVLKKNGITDVERNYCPRQHNLILRSLFSEMMQDIMQQTTENINRIKPQNVDDIRKCPFRIVAFSDDMIEDMNSIRVFLKERMYLDFRVKKMMFKAKRVIRDLFNCFLADCGLLPPEWKSRFCDLDNEENRVIVISDYIANMTDRYALQEHFKLFGSSYE